MKTTKNTRAHLAKAPALVLTGLLAHVAAQASSDYGPAIWNPACSGHWYTSGYGHKFHVIHDMEGYYLSTISYFQNCSTSASVHYCVNGQQDTGTDHAAGEITQMVLEANYAWHVCCWNRYCTGTEHEGFASNPAWYTMALYQASAGITAHEVAKFGYPADRNHIVGHNEWQNGNWTAYAGPAFGINTGCNTHHDPGSYWDWSTYMGLVTGINPPYYFDDSADGWTVGNALNSLTWQAPGAWPGIVYGDQTANDAYMIGPACGFSNLGYAPCVSVNVYPQSGTSASHDMQVFWSTSAENYFDATKSSPIVSYTAQNTWVRLNLNVNTTKWLGQNITRLRVDFDNSNTSTRWIVNDVVPQNTVPTYLFNSDVQGWTAGNSETAPWWTGTGWPGVLVTDQTGNDGFIYSPGSLNYLGAQNDILHVRVYPQNGNTSLHDMQVFWTTSADGTWTASKSSAVVNYVAQNGWTDVYLPVGANGAWVNWITQLRLDFDNTNHGNRWIVDTIEVLHQNTLTTVTSVPDIIIDNTSATVTGTWSSGTSSTDKYGSDYRFKSKGTGSAFLQYTPTIQTPGYYQVYEWHPQGSNRTTVAPHVITYNGGNATVNVNQQTGGGTWNLLGTFNFATGTAGNVSINDGYTDAGAVVMADAIKFVYFGQ